VCLFKAFQLKNVVPHKKGYQFFSQIFFLFIAITFLVNPFLVFAQKEQVFSVSEQNLAQLIDKLSAEQKIGQLFLVTFEGNELNPDSKIVDLISNHYVSGVILKRDNNNFIGPEKTIENVLSLINSLQNTAAGIFPVRKDEKTLSTATPFITKTKENYIPLFVGVSQEGDSYPYDQILNGLSQLPNLMAIGATWDISEAEKVGKVLGSELHQLGFNLFIGPSLDVLDINYSGSGDDLGTRTFGGDPFWVSQMGKAYIRGIHAGSENQIAVVAKHFPGRGGSDRLPEAEVATVRKSLDQLRLIELAPFFSVTGNALNSNEKVEGLFLSHIRYQGLQGNIRAFTKPISLDPSALGILMNLPEFSEWRKQGGIIVSDDLGSRAIRHSFDPTGKNFDARQVVLNAFLAGNDLLYMDRILATNDQDTYTTVVRVLDFFVQKYREDSAFADRVDASVERILKLKSGIYKNFDVNLVKPKVQFLEKTEKDEKVAFGVASKAITLLSPEKKDLINTIPQAPNLRSNIIFFTDQLNFSQCSQCKKQTDLSVDEFQKSVIKLYGPEAGSLVNPNRLSSYSLEELNNYLDAPLSHLDLESNLNKADWIIFSLLTPDPNRPASNAFHRIISERPQLVRDKKVIAFAFNTPYRLDATDISNLTAYYGVFSKIDSFVEIAARVIFQEITPQGASPVSVPGIAYDLNTATSPNPQQSISLVIDWDENQSKNTLGLSTPAPAFFIGDTIPLRAGLILDHNGHSVPDGTVVKFLFNLTGEKRMSQQIETVTKNGIARTNFRIQDPGMLEIRVNSDPSFNSDILMLEITPGKSIVVSAITPTVIPTSISDQPNAGNQTNTLYRKIFIGSDFKLEWLIVFLMLWLIVGFFLWMGTRYFTIKWGIRAGLTTAIGGFLSYLWIILGLPGSLTLFYSRALTSTIIVVLIGGGIGFLVYWLWNQYSRTK
jgi:beta-N-acetylhexosaminidase